MNALRSQAVAAVLIVKPAEQLAHMEAPWVQSAPVLATPLAHVHVFAKSC